MYIEYSCEFCGKQVRKKQSGTTNHRFCDNHCKSEWQRLQKPVTKEWLYQKYVVEGLDCTQIGKIVERDSKTVWNWLKDLEIPTRKRGTTGNYKKAPKRVGWKHSDEAREKIKQARLKDGHVPYLNKDGVHHLKGKKGSDTPNWKGGVTPDRQAVYSSPEWKEAVKVVWKRDNATCQKCGLHRSQARKEEIDFDIHHIVSFAVKELRCEPSNLVLLCETCHYWVHSNDNINKEWLNE